MSHFAAAASSSLTSALWNALVDAALIASLVHEDVLLVGLSMSIAIAPPRRLSSCRRPQSQENDCGLWPARGRHPRPGDARPLRVACGSTRSPACVDPAPPWSRAARHSPQDYLIIRVLRGMLGNAANEDEHYPCCCFRPAPRVHLLIMTTRFLWLILILRLCPPRGVRRLVGLVLVASAHVDWQCDPACRRCRCVPDPCRRVSAVVAQLHQERLVP